jgi:retron-type reverse transcriptase
LILARLIIRHNGNDYNTQYFTGKSIVFFVVIGHDDSGILVHLKFYIAAMMRKTLHTITY